jgi:regulator of RNase E activity RraB
MPTDPTVIGTLKRSQDPDAMVLVQMAEHGADLTKQHEPDFAFEIPTKEAAEKVAAELFANGYRVEVFEPDEENPRHQVLAKRLMVLDLLTLNKLTIQFEALAKKYGGIYDGWGAEIVE